MVGAGIVPGRLGGKGCPIDAQESRVVRGIHDHLLARTPGTLRGQVIATQGLIGNIASLVPTLLAGIATDIFGVKPIAVAIAVCIVIAAMAAHSVGRRNAEVPSMVPQT